MKFSRKCLIPAAILLGVLLASVPALGVSPSDEVLVQQAAKNLQQENYEEALAQLTEAWRTGPHTAQKAYYLGVVHRQLLQYPKARDYLEEAVRLKPDYMEARRLLADTLITLDKPDLALVQLKELEKAGYQPAQTAMMQGQVAMKQKRYREALDYFDKAKTDPALAQEATLQASLALAAQNRLKEAQKTLKETITLAPQTSTAAFAQRYEKAVESRLEEIRPFHFNVYAGVDYDSNITLQPGGAAAATQVSGKGGVAFSYGGYAEYNLLPQGPLGLLTNYAYFQNFHPSVPNYDLLSNTAGLTPTYQFQNGRLWVPFTYNYTDVQYDAYYSAFNLAPTYLHFLTTNVGLEVGGTMAREYYWYPISFPQDDRSGRNMGGNLGLYYFFKNQQGYLQTRFSYVHDWTGGTNWDNSSYRLLTTAVYPITNRLKVTAFLDLMLQPYNFRFYDGSQSPPAYEGKRYDKDLITGLALSYQIWKGLEGNVHYYFIRDDSNVSLYNYNRHLAGVQLSYQY